MRGIEIFFSKNSVSSHFWMVKPSWVYSLSLKHTTTKIRPVKAPKPYITPGVAPHGESDHLNEYVAALDDQAGLNK